MEKHTKELIVEVGALEDHLLKFSEIVNDINNITSGAVIAKDSATGLRSLMPYA